MTNPKKPAAGNTDSADTMPPERDIVREAQAILKSESDAITAAAQRIDESFTDAIDCMLHCQGRIIVTGMGKMGCIARKAVATFCSTGAPAVFLHPSEAAHGDLGIVTQEDVLIVLSYSGETREVTGLLPYMARIGVPVIGLTGNPHNTLASRCRFVIDIGVDSEADPAAVAPTNSTTVALAMCDALAIILMNCRGFTPEQFAIFHPGGNLGGKLLIQVADLMHEGDRIPIARETDTLRHGIQVISSKGLGAVFVVSSTHSVLGVITDGDLRRILEQSWSQNRPTQLDEPISDRMKGSPKTIPSGALAAEALRLMEDNGISILPVVDPEEKLVGVIHLHDLIRAGLA